MIEGEGPGGLRRAMSEELLSDVGTVGGDVQGHSVGAVYKGLMVSDKPSEITGSRVRRNSAGDEGYSPRCPQSDGIEQLGMGNSQFDHKSDPHCQVSHSIVSHSTNSESNYQHGTSTSDASDMRIKNDTVGD